MSRCSATLETVKRIMDGDVPAEIEQDLNRLNEKYGINDHRNSVHLKCLFEHHDILSKSDLKQEIREHRDGGCENPDCWTETTNAPLECGRQLYEAQMDEWDEYRYQKSVCKCWSFNLFVNRMLDGESKEREAIKQLREADPEFEFELADSRTDSEQAVDIEVMYGSTVFCGIQVKPSSYKSTSGLTKFQNLQKNDTYDYPVFYLFYDDDGDMENIDEVVDQINSLLLDLLN